MSVSQASLRGTEKEPLAMMIEEKGSMRQGSKDNVFSRHQMLSKGGRAQWCQMLLTGKLGEWELSTGFNNVNKMKSLTGAIFVEYGTKPYCV